MLLQVTPQYLIADVIISEAMVFSGWTRFTCRCCCCAPFNMWTSEVVQSIHIFSENILRVLSSVLDTDTGSKLTLLRLNEIFFKDVPSYRVMNITMLIAISTLCGSWLHPQHKSTQEPAVESVLLLCTTFSQCAFPQSHQQSALQRSRVCAYISLHVYVCLFVCLFVRPVISNRDHLRVTKFAYVYWLSYVATSTFWLIQNSPKRFYRFKFAKIWILQAVWLSFYIGQMKRRSLCCFCMRSQISKKWINYSTYFMIRWQYSLLALLVRWVECKKSIHASCFDLLL